MALRVTGKRKPVRPDARNVVRGQQTRRRILVAARARILAEGFEALRLDDLARDVDVTKAAVVKSVGGKASILLELGDEDRLTRLDVLRRATGWRSGLRRRLAETSRRLLDLDAPRLNVVMPYVGYMWFWTDADHARAQAMLDETRSILRDLIAAASNARLSSARLETMALRFLGGYAIALRDLRYGRATKDQASRSVVDFVLDGTDD